MLQFNPDWRFDSPGALSPEAYRGLCELMRPLINRDDARMVYSPRSLAETIGKQATTRGSPSNLL